MKHMLNRLGGWILAFTSMILLSVTAVQAESTWERIQSTGKLRMGVLQAVPWFSKNPASGEWDSGPAGIDRRGHGQGTGRRTRNGRSDLGHRHCGASSQQDRHDVSGYHAEACDGRGLYQAAAALFFTCRTGQ